MRFTLQRDRYRRLSAYADGPSGRDVDCRVHVRVRLMPAGCALENRLAPAVFRCAIPADATGLRRAGWIDLLYSPRRLVFEAPHEMPPTVGEDATIETGLCAAPVRQVRAWPFGVGPGLGTLGHLGDAIAKLHARARVSARSGQLRTSTDLARRFDIIRIEDLRMPASRPVGHPIRLRLRKSTGQPNVLDPIRRDRQFLISEGGTA